MKAVSPHKLLTLPTLLTLLTLAILIALLLVTVYTWPMQNSRGSELGESGFGGI